jgi:hypothetical protein
MVRMETSRRQGCFEPKYIAMALVAAAVIIAAALAAKAFPRGSWQRISLAVVQAIVTGVVLLMPMWSMRRLDEMQRQIQLEALAFAFFGTGVLGVGYGFLESAGLPRIDWGALLWPAMAGLWAVGLYFSSRRYR